MSQDDALGIEGLLLVLLAITAAIWSKRVSLPVKSALAGIPPNSDAAAWLGERADPGSECHQDRAVGLER